jgi:hypothetical protein
LEQSGSCEVAKADKRGYGVMFAVSVLSDGGVKKVSESTLQIIVTLKVFVSVIAGYLNKETVKVRE